MDPNQQPATPPNLDEAGVAPAPIPEPETPAFAAAPQASETPEALEIPEAPVAPIAPVAPVAPEAPVSPAFAPAPEAPLTTPPQKSNKKLGLILGIAGGAVVLLAAIGFLAYFLISQVSKEDYQAANTQYDKVAVETDKLNDLGDTFFDKLSETKDQASYDKFSEDTKAILTTAKAQNDDLAKLKAARFGESGSLYGKFNDKFKSSVSYKADLIDSFDKYIGAMLTCRKDLDTSNLQTMDVGKYYKSCSEKLGAAGTLPNKSLEAYRKEAASQFGILAGAYAEYTTAVNAKDKTTADAATKKGQAATDKLADAAKTARDTLSTEVKANTATEEGKALKTFLDEKSK